jgi:GT2 family glycosyltransferase
LALILAMTPFAEDLNLGRAYNEAMALLPDDAWACFLDHDMMLTTPHWHAQLQEAVAFLPDAGAFTACTNRIASSWQKAPEADSKSNDIAYHRQVGEARRSRRSLLDITCSKGFGGVLTLLSKAAWREAGGYADGMYCVDHSLFFRLVARGRRVFMLDGLYVYHFRGSSGARPPLVAPKVEHCPCRGAEQMPSIRLALP